MTLRSVSPNTCPLPMAPIFLEGLLCSQIDKKDVYLNVFVDIKSLLDNGTSGLQRHTFALVSPRISRIELSKLKSTSVE